MNHDHICRRCGVSLDEAWHDSDMESQHRTADACIHALSERLRELESLMGKSSKRIADLEKHHQPWAFHGGSDG